MQRLSMKQARGLTRLRLLLSDQSALCTRHLSSGGGLRKKRRDVDGTRNLPFQWLKLRAPEFKVNGEQVRVLRDPSEFYSTIKENISVSKRNVVLASLYLGDGPMEQDLVSSMHKALKRACTDGDKLNIHVLLDCVRGSRGKSNSRTMLLPLLQEFTSQMSVSLYHTPELRGAKKALIPERFNEAIGLSHLKVYTFDDNLLMSGANLSEMYFTNRQDRYVLIRDCPELVRFFNNLVLAVSSVSFQLQPDDSLSLYAQDSVHPVTGDMEQFKIEAFNRVQSVLESCDNDPCLTSLRAWQRTVLGRTDISAPQTNSTQCADSATETSRKSSSERSNSVLLAEETGGVHYAFEMPDDGRTTERSSIEDGVLASLGNDCHGDVDVGRKNGAVEKTVGQVRVQVQEEEDDAESQGTGYQGDFEHNGMNFVSETEPSARVPRTNDDISHENNARINQSKKNNRQQNAGSNIQGSTSSRNEAGIHSNVDDTKRTLDTVIYPLVQMGPLGVTMDQEVTRQLLGEGDYASVCYLASGYFNLTSEYMDTIIQSNATYEILMASPQVNGFYGSKGISGYIPHSYTFIARQFFHAMHQCRQQRRIRLYEYYRDAWTFHVKGLWYYVPEQHLPSLTLIGSPNFGHRSVHRDLEAQLAIVTESNSLRNQLHKEQEELYARAEKVTADTFREPARRVPLWTRLVTSITRNFF